MSIDLSDVVMDVYGSEEAFDAFRTKAVADLEEKFEVARAKFLEDKKFYRMLSYEKFRDLVRTAQMLGGLRSGFDSLCREEAPPPAEFRREYVAAPAQEPIPDGL